MIRRPLTPNPRTVHRHTELTLGANIPFVNSADFFPPYAQVSDQPLNVFSTDLGELASFVGFDEAPAKAIDRYPREPLPGQHPTAFLQWGWAAKSNQILFEIGDASRIITLHFIRPQPVKKQTPWHLDDILIDIGGDEYYQIPCDDPAYSLNSINLVTGVACALSSLNNDDWRQAENILKVAVAKTTGSLDDISNRLHREHADSLGVVIRAVPGPGQP